MDIQEYSSSQKLEVSRNSKLYFPAGYKQDCLINGTVINEKTYTLNTENLTGTKPLKPYKQEILMIVICISGSHFTAQNYQVFSIKLCSK